jgi:hypothetical protein
VADQRQARLTKWRSYASVRPTGQAIVACMTSMAPSLALSHFLALLALAEAEKHSRSAAVARARHRTAARQSSPTASPPSPLPCPPSNRAYQAKVMVHSPNSPPLP